MPEYTTENGNRLHFVIWKDGKRENDAFHGARILKIDYGAAETALARALRRGDRMDSSFDADNITDKFLNGSDNEQHGRSEDRDQ